MNNLIQFVKPCPNCLAIMIYGSKLALNNSIKRNSHCKNCQTVIRKPHRSKNFSKICELCGHITHYSDERKQKFGQCRSCVTKQTHINQPNRVKGKNNPLYGKTAYSIWVEKYGIEEADKRRKLQSEKQSQNSKGNNNHQFGKPSPEGSGRGFSGKFKELHFRSSYELAFLIQFEQRNNRLPISAECKEFSASFDNKNYFSDFYDAITQTLYEIKPKKLLTINAKKLETIKSMALSKGLKFELITEDQLTLPKEQDRKNWLLNLHNQGIVNFSEKQLTRLQNKEKQ